MTAFWVRRSPLLCVEAGLPTSSFICSVSHDSLFIYKPICLQTKCQTCLANKFRQQIILGRKYVCFQTKNVFVFEPNVFKTQNILLKHRAINLV